MEIYRIDWVDIKGNKHNGAAWLHQLKDLVKDLLKDEDVAGFTILNSVGKVIFKVTDDGDLIDELNIMNKLEE